MAEAAPVSARWSCPGQATPDLIRGSAGTRKTASSRGAHRTRAAVSSYSRCQTAQFLVSRSVFLSGFLSLFALSFPFSLLLHSHFSFLGFPASVRGAFHPCPPPKKG